MESSSLTEKRLGFQHYRFIQCLAVFINSGFQYYLKWFSTILFGIVALLLFSCIKFWGIGIRAYLMFPSCAVRCVFESVTLLAIAGKTNKACLELLRTWREESRHIETTAVTANSRDEEIPKQTNTSTNSAGWKWLSRFQKSCRIINCAAADLFTFENTIVMVTVNNCIQLTLNLLLIKF
jgi:hypothetical protein